MKQCVLYERACTECNECNICDLDENKICDNCCKCIETEQKYKEILIDRIEMGEDKLK